MSVRAFEGWTARVNYAQAHALVDRALWGTDLMRRRAAHRTIDAAASISQPIDIVHDGRNTRMYAANQRVTAVAVLKPFEAQRFLEEQKVDIREGV